MYFLKGTNRTHTHMPCLNRWARDSTTLGSCMRYIFRSMHEAMNLELSYSGGMGAFCSTPSAAHRASRLLDQEIGGHSLAGDDGDVADRALWLKHGHRTYVLAHTALVQE